MGTDIHGVWQKKTDDGWDNVPSTYSQDRHYLLFAWLGNVRNGFGFAGVPTHTPVIPLSDGRGYPADFELSDEDMHPIKSLEHMDPSRQQWHEPGEPMVVWMGDHSHSWLSADEILEAERPKIQRTGVVPLEWFKTWDNTTPPEHWSGWTGGVGVKVVGPDDMSEDATHVQITWEENTTETLDYFVAEVQRLKDLHGEIRFVFGFDS